ncbi:MAG TPA: hypothetical protein VFW12_09180 [Candidatus Limnocylindria bacterium]|nr:hypothetical protein [Candidatus Limnocylindria bacterium]
MPFFPLFIVWQVFGKSSTFALGWATSLFFGQIPGNKGRVVSAASVLSLAWVLLLVLVGPILSASIVADALGLIALDRMDFIKLDDVVMPLLGLVFLPPLITLMAELARFHERSSLRRWVSRLPLSYPIALSLGTGLLLMLVITPFLQLRRAREGRATQHLPLLVKEGRFEQLACDIEPWLEELTGEAVTREEYRGVASWPLRVLRFAAARLLRSVVSDAPVRLRAGASEVALFATALSVTAPKDDVYRLRAALHKRLALTEAFLTWSEVPQRFEAELMKLHTAKLPLDERIAALERLQDEIDAARMKSDEWDVLYRLRLQVERDAYESAASARSRAKAG